MTVIEEILLEFWNTELHYKGVTVNIFGIPKFSSYKKNTLHQTLSRLKKKGYISEGEDMTRLTQQGREYIKKKIDSLKDFDKPVDQKQEKTLLVMFDIPETMKSHREWFRWHLKKFNYAMIQKSVWVGPDPLPKEFSDYTKEIGLYNCIKTFKLAKPYRGSKSVNL